MRYILANSSTVMCPPCSGCMQAIKRYKQVQPLALHATHEITGIWFLMKVPLQSAESLLTLYTTDISKIASAVESKFSTIS